MTLGFNCSNGLSTICILFSIKSLFRSSPENEQQSLLLDDWTWSSEKIMLELSQKTFAS
jgi:hypothetical protein